MKEETAGRRAELERIRVKYNEKANAEGVALAWIRAYLRLADAADNLDAMLSRAENADSVTK